MMMTTTPTTHWSSSTTTTSSDRRSARRHRGRWGPLPVLTGDGIPQIALRYQHLAQDADQKLAVRMSRMTRGE